jgi:protein phosphatase
LRLGNEDSLLLWQMDASLAGVRTPFTLALVADGAGGHAGGEIASQAAVQVVAAQLAGSLLPGLAAGRLPDPAALRLAAVAALQAANAELRRLRQQRGNDMLTTSVLALCVEQRALVANVGDSRAYLVRAGRLRQVSEDHTLVARLLRLGQLTPEEARSHARRHQLYRALGHDQDVEVDLFELDMQPGDLLLLCSDGLTEEVGEEAIGHILAGAADLDAACRALTEAAVAAGGRDNVSVILARPLG